MVALAQCYAYGNGVVKDMATALKWLREATFNAADQDRDSAAYLGAFLLHAPSQLANHQEGLKLLRQAAIAGSVFAQFEYGQCLAQGVGTEKSYAEAFEWFDKAAAQGDPFSQYNLAVLLHHGKGCVKDTRRAFQLYKKSAEAGAARACIQLAVLGSEETTDEDRVQDSISPIANVFSKWEAESSALFRAIVDVKRIVEPFVRLTESRYGVALKCSLLMDDEKSVDVVVKSPLSAELTAGLFNEWLALSQIPRHPNVHAFLGVCEGFRFVSNGDAITRDFSFITKYEANGSIEDYIQKHGPAVLSKELLLRWTLDIARGLDHLHNHKLVHRDLAARNVLLKSDLRAVVADFGLLRRVDDAKDEGAAVYKSRSLDGTPLEQAPECVLHMTFSPASDVFAWALTVFEIATACAHTTPLGLDPDDSADEQYARMKASADKGYPVTKLELVR